MPPFPILYSEAQKAWEDFGEDLAEEEELSFGGGWRPRIQVGGLSGERIHDCAEAEVSAMNILENEERVDTKKPTFDQIDQIPDFCFVFPA